MKIGVVFPQTAIGPSATAVREFGTTVESLGYTHVLTYEHVLGADPEAHAPWTGGFDVDTTFREPFVMFGYLAALTSLELVTGVVILPQRQTALVAKQAAEVDLLTEGRFRLGVGLGWNAVEYEALGQSFRSRGRRLDEQVPLLRRLWNERSVTHHGEFDTVPAAGLAPAPLQRPIPIWIGGESPPAYERIGRLADGWFPQVGPGPQLDEARAIIDQAAVAAGRDPATIGMEGRAPWVPSKGAAFTVDVLGMWHEAGASHVSIHTMNAGLEGVHEHLAALDAIAPHLASFEATAG